MDEIEAPWFRIADPLPKGATVAVIGGGIGGLCAATALDRVGTSVRLYDRLKTPGGGASATPAAIVQPRAFVKNSVVARFHADAYRRAIALYDRLSDLTESMWLARGVLAVGRDDSGAARHEAFVGSGLLAEDDAQWLDVANSSRAVGVSVCAPGAWFPRAGCLDTGRLCMALAVSLDVQCGTPIKTLKSDGGKWRLLGGDQSELGVADAVVVAAGADTKALIAALDLGTKRGQVSLVETCEATHSMSGVLTFGGYLTPAVVAGRHVLGATFDTAVADGTELRSADNDRNLKVLTTRVPALRGLSQISSAHGWTGVRATTSDTLPVVGPVPDSAFYREAYEAIRHGSGHRRFRLAKYQSGLYVFAGFGSHGFLTAPYAAEILAAVMLGRPVTVEKKLLSALHPGRFLVRALRRGKSRVTVPPAD